MSDVATPVIENAETLGEEAPRIAQRRASAKAREDDRKVIFFYLVVTWVIMPFWDFSGRLIVVLLH